MTKIKESTHRVCPVFESPDPTHTRIYLAGEGHNKTTLAPIFNANINWSNSASNGVASTQSYHSGAGNTYFDGAQSYEAGTGKFGYGMALSKETAVSQHYSASDNNANSSWLPHSKIVMDPNESNGSIRRYTDGSGNQRIFWTKSNWPYSRYYITGWYNPGGEFDETYPDVFQGDGGYTGNGERDVPIIPVMKDPNSDYVVWVTHQHREYQGYSDRPMTGWGRSTFTGHSSIDYNQNQRDHYTTQYIGQGSDGLPMFLQNAKDNDYTQYIMRYNVGSNNNTQLHLFNTAPTASGTSYGGARGTTTIGSGICKYASQTFADFTSGAAAEDLGFYLPYFDTNYDYHPFYYQYDYSTNTYTRNEDITISGDKSSTHMAFPHNDVGNNAGHRCVAWNDTFVSGGTRYLTVMFLTGGNAIADAADNQRTIVTYSCGASDPKTLTHHSTVTCAETMKQHVWLNDAKTIFGIIGNNALHVFTWDNSAGWEETSTIAGKFHCVGRDSTDRIWATEQSSNGDYTNIHVLSLDVPISVVITPAASSYNYTGTTINTSVGVSAYNISGDRIATDVKLTIDGTSMEFAGGSDSATVTTLTNADVSQNVNILSAGVSDIIANIAL